MKSCKLDYDAVAKAKSRDITSLTRDLRAWARKHGSLDVTSLMQTDSALEEAVRTKFGSLAAAAEKLGLKYKPRNKRWSAQRVKEEIRKRRKAGEDLRAARVKVDDRSLYDAGLRYFGDWALVIRRSSR